MKTVVLALAAAAALGFAAPAFASDGARNQACADCVNLSAGGVAIEKVDLQAQDFSSGHRHHWRRHHWRRHHHHSWRRHHCERFWRHGHLVTVCG